MNYSFFFKRCGYSHMTNDKEEIKLYRKNHECIMVGEKKKVLRRPELILKKEDL